MVTIPAAASRRSMFLPTPGMSPGWSARSRASRHAWSRTVSPSGFSMSAAILASRRFGATPIDERSSVPTFAAMPALTRRASAATCAGAFSLSHRRHATSSIDIWR